MHALSLSAGAARRLAIGAQGLDRPRLRRAGGAADLVAALERLGTIQVDAVSVVARTQYLVAFSRIGSYAPRDLDALSAPQGAWFEYWGHAASLIPSRLHPLFRSRMQRFSDDMVDSPAVQERRRAWRRQHAGYLESVLAEVAERGPLSAAQLSEPRRRAGQWWERRSDGRRALEVLFGDGVLAAWRSPSFERIYDLTERVIPADVLALPTPTLEEAQRELVLVAARCLGVATVEDLADYFWLRVPATRARVAELVEDGRLLVSAVEGWAKPGYLVPGAQAATRLRRHATLLSPFDSLIWRRERAERLFAFHYRIEIYVPPPRRTFGYYVLPVLVGDAIVGRVDLKAERRARTLRVLGAFTEPGRHAGATGRALAGELRRLGDWLGCEQVAVEARGDLAPALARELSAGREA